MLAVLRSLRIKTLTLIFVGMQATVSPAFSATQALSPSEMGERLASIYQILVSEADVANGPYRSWLTDEQRNQFTAEALDIISQVPRYEMNLKPARRVGKVGALIFLAAVMVSTIGQLSYQQHYLGIQQKFQQSELVRQNEMRDYNQDLSSYKQNLRQYTEKTHTPEFLDGQSTYVSLMMRNSNGTAPRNLVMRWYAEEQLGPAPLPPVAPPNSHNPHQLELESAKNIKSDLLGYSSIGGASILSVMAAFLRKAIRPEEKKTQTLEREWEPFFNAIKSISKEGKGFKGSTTEKIESVERLFLSFASPQIRQRVTDALSELQIAKKCEEDLALADEQAQEDQALIDGAAVEARHLANDH